MKKPQHEIIIGSNNRHKIAELKSLLKTLNIKVTPLGKLGKVPEVIENGRTFETNASKKARVYSMLSDKLTLADDSGLCVTSLNNKPGVYSARYAGPGCTYDDNNRKLLTALAGHSGSGRGAVFYTAIALYLRGKKIKFLKGACRGRIALEIRGSRGFGYDPVFIPNGQKKTFAELTSAQKNKISHRAKALQLTKKFLLSFLRKQESTR